jgi:hypothetical protein
MQKPPGVFPTLETSTNHLKKVSGKGGFKDPDTENDFFEKGLAMLIRLKITPVFIRQLKSDNRCLTTGFLRTKTSFYAAKLTGWSIWRPPTKLILLTSKPENMTRTPIRCSYPFIYFW